VGVHLCAVAIWAIRSSDTLIKDLVFLSGYASGERKGASVTIAEVRSYQDKTVILKLSDGEITTAKIAFVDAEYEDIVVDIISTNRPDNYRHSDAAYTIAAGDLVSIEEVSGLISKSPTPNPLRS
jgi:hypothetical protein